MNDVPVESAFFGDVLGDEIAHVTYAAAAEAYFISFGVVGKFPEVGVGSRSLGCEHRGVVVKHAQREKVGALIGSVSEQYLRDK